MSGREFELLGYAHTWGEQRVFFRPDGSDRVHSMPAAWTSMVAPDPLVVIANGRAFFRVDDLLGLARLIADLDRGDRQ